MYARAIRSCVSILEYNTVHRTVYNGMKKRLDVPMVYSLMQCKCICICILFRRVSSSLLSYRCTVGATFARIKTVFKFQHNVQGNERCLSIVICLSFLCDFILCVFLLVFSVCKYKTGHTHTHYYLHAQVVRERRTCECVCLCVSVHNVHRF